DLLVEPAGRQDAAVHADEVVVGETQHRVAVVQMEEGQVLLVLVENLGHGRASCSLAPDNHGKLRIWWTPWSSRRLASTTAASTTPTRPHGEKMSHGRRWASSADTTSTS